MMRTRQSVLRRVVIAGVCLALSACALKTPPERSELAKQALGDAQPPPQWRGGASTPGAVGDGWLKTLNEPRLDALVDETLARNVDLCIAATRGEQAEASLKIAGATLYPAVNLLAREGGKMGGDGSGVNVVGLFASWGLDLWGRVRAEREAGAVQYAATLADTEFARQSIAALVAKSWLLAVCSLALLSSWAPARQAGRLSIRETLIYQG